ncbi:MAG: glycosyltransferase family 4 protein [Sedimentisphaerales bacterium]
MKVFMLGWEFPPFISGGLGTACYGLTKAMDQLGIKIDFVLPRTVESEYSTHVELLTPGSTRAKAHLKYKGFKNVTFWAIDSPLRPYETAGVHGQHGEKISAGKQQIPGSDASSAGRMGDGMDCSGDICTMVHRYAEAACKLAEGEQFDIIHSHDWMTYPAGVAVAAMSGQPLVVHVHSTEFDRSGEHVNQIIYDIERKGMHAADKVIAVSYLTRNIIITRYGVAEDKVEVVYNAVEQNDEEIILSNQTGIKRGEKIVLFLGRITMQKGPEYFLQAAKKVLDFMDNVKFVIAGDGDMMHQIIEMAVGLGIGHKVLFAGFLCEADVKKAFEMADLYVMPSVSEPFGIAALEALNHDVPVLISKQSGVSEILRNVLKVDFWDTDETANKMVSVLKNPPLQMTLREHGDLEVRKLRWQYAAEKCAKVYEELTVTI